ncbi:MAG: acyltransferase [Bacteroidales bacterium]|nr:acyltransferase [Bacteroidales bacterium]
MKINSPQFDDIRPFYDVEIPPAMQRIAENHLFPLLSSYVYPQRPIEEVRSMLHDITTISEFQFEVMKSFNEQVLARSISNFSYDGIKLIDSNRRYLFISNHRDIVLDSSLLQYILFKNGHDTTEITFGANLMCTPLIIDIGKSNKMFKVEREGSMHYFYKSSLLLSQYIRYALTEKNQSVWIAQRNGRTKDGNDSTDKGIIKMFCMSSPKDKVTSLTALNIVPVAVSYEWEPCDTLKAVELYKSNKTKYTKRQGEDLNSILTGIFQSKGCVHFSICEPITEKDLYEIRDCTDSEFHKRVATLIDRRILSHYHLTANNFIAYDLLNKSNHFNNKYSIEQKESFLHNMSHLEEYHVSELDRLKKIFLGIYANPIGKVLTNNELILDHFTNH